MHFSKCDSESEQHQPAEMYRVISNDKSISTEKIENQEYINDKSPHMLPYKNTIQNNVQQIPDNLCTNTDVQNQEQIKKEWENDSYEQEEQNTMLQPVIVKPTNLVPVLPASTVVKRVVPVVSEKNNSTTCKLYINISCMFFNYFL